MTGAVSGQSQPSDVAFVRILGVARFVNGHGERVDLPSPSQPRLLALLALQAATVRG